MNLGEKLTEMYPDTTKSTLKSWLKQGRVWVDGKVEKSWVKPLEKGQKVELVSKEKVLAQGIPILYQDAHMIVLDKPSGLLSVATDREKVKTLHAYLKAHFRPRKVYVIHRLDKETSGVIIFGLSEKGYAGLKELFKEHDITRRYLACVEGKVEEEKGKWDTHIFEDKNFKMHVSEDKGERAITHWKVVKRGKDNTLIECSLKTGKKNQIRVQAENFGHPLLGDTKYGGKPAKRLALHATMLEFVHPITQKRVRFTAKPPEDFNA